MQRHFNIEKSYCLEDFGLGRDYYVLRISKCNKIGRLKGSQRLTQPATVKRASLVSDQDIRSSGGRTRREWSAPGAGSSHGRLLSHASGVDEACWHDLTGPAGTKNGALEPGGGGRVPGRAVVEDDRAILHGVQRRTPGNKNDSR
jgi:hypothetical protein